MEESNKKEGYLNIEPIDNEENINLNLISGQNKNYYFNKKYIDIIIIIILTIIFTILIVIKQNKSKIPISDNIKEQNNDIKKEDPILDKKEKEQKEPKIEVKTDLNKDIKNEEDVKNKKDIKKDEEKKDKVEVTNIQENKKDEADTKKYNSDNQIKKYISKLLPRDQALDSGISYVKKCAAGTLINKDSIQIVEKPLISIVIPCYFCEQFIKKAVRSVQNQNFMEIKIIIVVDGRNEKTQKVLQDLTKEDPRIELIYNEKRMGILYSRSIGILQANSQYVMTLDQDDLFFDSDVFSYLYVIAEDEYLDMIVFQVFESRDIVNKKIYKDNFNNKDKEHNLTIYQPELSCHTLIKKDKYQGNDFFVWGKFYRTSVYKSAINMLGKARYSILMEWEEDVIITFLIVNVANSYKFVKKYGYLHLIHGGTPTSTLPILKKNFYRLIKVEIFFDFAKKECKNAPANELIEMKNVFGQQLNRETRIYMKRLIKKILVSEEVDEKYKDEIKKVFAKYFPNISNFNEQNYF